MRYTTYTPRMVEARDKDDPFPPATCGPDSAPRSSSCPTMAVHTLFASGYGGNIYTLTFDSVTNEFTQTHAVEAGKGPTWILKRDSLLYTVVELAQSKDGQLRVYKINGDGELELAGEKAAGGAGPTHLTTSTNGRQLYSANYAGGSLGSLALESDGMFRKTDREDEVR